MHTRQKPTEAELGYMAGIIDGEGCIAVTLPGNRKGVPPLPGLEKRSHEFHVKVAMTDPEAIEPFVKYYGGKIRVAKKDQRYSTRPLYCWWLYADNAARCLNDLLPYLRIKRAQAEALIESRNTVAQRGVDGCFQALSETEVRLRDVCARAIRQRNQRNVGLCTITS